jgi:hypothetical protein
MCPYAGAPLPRYCLRFSYCGHLSGKYVILLEFALFPTVAILLRIPASVGL